MEVIPLSDNTFGAEIRGLDLGQLTNRVFSELYEVFLTYGFFLIRNQLLDEHQQVEFGQRFGTLEFGALPLANQIKQPDGNYTDVFAADSHRMLVNRGNEAWHTDSTYWPVSSKCAMLTAVKVPAEGGQTELADARAGYADLPEELRGRVQGRSAYHSTQYSQAKDLQHYPKQKADSIYHGEAYLRPLVKVHPETGRPNLMVGRHAFGVPGLSRSESRELIESLTDFVVSDPARVYTHQWQVGDTLVWDNRALLHRARPYDYQQPRVLIGTRIKGDVPSELAYYPDDSAAEAGRAALSAELACLRSEVKSADGQLAS